MACYALTEGANKAGPNLPVNNNTFQTVRNCFIISVSQCRTVGLLLEPFKCPYKEAGIRKSWASYCDLAHCWLLFEPAYLSSLSVVPSLCCYLSTLSFLLLRLNCRLSSYQSFLDILNETNDYAGQRELIAENMMMSICIDLTKYLQELKQERKTVSLMWSKTGECCVRPGHLLQNVSNKVNFGCLRQ